MEALVAPCSPPLRARLAWMLLWASAALSAGSATAGCATGGDVNRRGGDGAAPGFDAGTTRRDAARPIPDAAAAQDAAPPSCEPPCRSGDVCRDGMCVPAGVDEDDDGVAAEEDCDDADPAVGRIAERTCSSACGPGVERCADGVWGACNAPLTCDCTSTDPPRELDCGRCGTQRQICVEGMWADDGTCTGEGACTPGVTETGSACGCGGTQQRTCGSDCAWGGWSCGDGGTICTPGQTQTDSDPCGNCDLGNRTRTRTCASDGCSWGTWSAWSSCSGGGTCAPGDTRYGCDRSTTGTTSCGIEVCTSSCTWGGCQLAPGAKCMSNMGTNFQCCEISGASGWQYCDASRCDWFPCASHTCS